MYTYLANELESIAIVSASPFSATVTVGWDGATVGSGSIDASALVSYGAFRRAVLDSMGVQFDNSSYDIGTSSASRNWNSRVSYLVSQNG